MNGPMPTIVLSGAWIALAFRFAARAQRRLGDRAPRATSLAALACAVAVAAVALDRPEPTRLACALACSALAIAAFADARTGYLFDAITFPTALVTAVAALACGAGKDAALGVLVVVGGFGAIVVLSRGTLMGLGDVKAMYAIGAAFGPVHALIVVGAASISGIASAIVTRQMARRTEIRFGPHLAVGSVFTVVAGDSIVHGVLGL